MNYWLVKIRTRRVFLGPTGYQQGRALDRGSQSSAKLNLKAMKKGDLAFFYHSNIGKEIVGIVKVVREAYPDPSAEKGDWVCVDMQAVQPVPAPVSLATIKADPRFSDMALVRLSRLSVAPVSAAHWSAICEMGQVKLKKGAKHDN